MIYRALVLGFALYQGMTLVVPHRTEMMRALAPAMAIPARNGNPEAILSSARVFFATTKTSMGRRILQSERNATLLIEVLRSNVATGKFQLHDFVIMPDHLHPLISVPRDATIERAMQLVKGGFSFRLRKEYGFRGEAGSVDSPKCGSAIRRAF
jgi:REP element-mobilizing transposase RayT